MSILCSPSTTGTVISKIAPRQVLPFLYPIAHDISTRTKKESKGQYNQYGTISDNTLELWFLASLVRTSQCHKHKTRIPQASKFLTPQRSGKLSRHKNIYTTCFRRQQHTRAYFSSQAPSYSDDEIYKSQDDVEVGEPNRTREELLALVDQYGGTSVTDQLPLVELPRLYQPSDGPHLTVSDKVEDEWPAPYQEWPADNETKDKLVYLAEVLLDRTTDPETIYGLYQCLPSPRAPYLPAKTRHKLLRHLALVDRKDEESMLRYFSVINDMKSTAIPLAVSEWNSAVSFAARWVHKSTEVEVEAAIHIWREMEHIAGVKADEVTFNILFDVACKAGKFTLAEMLYKEMENRGLPETRFHHVSRICFHGLQEDGDGVRAAFKELENAGEIIDTIVLNALIVSFIHSNEASQAEQIYGFMVEKSNPELRPKTYLEQKDLTKTYRKWAKAVRKQPHKYAVFQEKASIGPDVHTYRILFNYFGVTVGDLEKVAVFLDQLIELNIPLHGGHFLAFFKGFAMHGGIRYTKWTEDLLERTWTIFISAIDEEAEDLYISKWMVLWSLRAFAKCSGKSRMIAVWEEFRAKWHPTQEELDFILPNLRRIMDVDDTAVRRKDWILGPN